MWLGISLAISGQTVEGSPSPTPSSTFSPDDKHADVTLSEDDLRMTTSSSDKAVRGTLPHLTGKWYFEVERVNGPGGVGLATSMQVLGTWAGNTAQSIAFDAGSGEVFNNGGSLGNPGVGSLDNGEVLGVTADLDTKKVWFSLNGAFGSGQDPATDTGGYDFSGLSALAENELFILVSGGDVASSYRLKTSQFTHSPSSGFVGWG